MDLDKIYSEGKNVSHAAGLSAVFEAGRQSMIPPVLSVEPVVEEVVKPAPVVVKATRKASFTAPVAKAKKKGKR